VKTKNPVCLTHHTKDFCGKKKMHYNRQISKKYFKKKNTLHILTIGSSKWPKIGQDSFFKNLLISPFGEMSPEKRN
jgi:hypothetical protein